MAEHILGIINKEEELEEEVAINAEKILGQIEIDVMLVDPFTYLNELAQAFLSDHMDEIEQGAKEGEMFAEKVLKKS